MKNPAWSQRVGKLGMTLVLLLIGHSTLSAKSSFPSMMPNGMVNRCANCHVRSSGGGPRNAFGQDVALALRQGPAFWTSALAALDSDGDGFTNGEELGDPDGDGVAQEGMNVTLPGNAADFPIVVSPPSDTEAPVLTLLGLDSIELIQGTPFVDPGVSVSDNLDTDLTYTVEGDLDINQVGSYTLIYTAIDQAGNLAAPLQRLIHVIPAETTLVTRRESNQLVLSWEGQGRLQVATSPAGPWSDLATATSPHAVTMSQLVQFYRVR